MTFFLNILIIVVGSLFFAGRLYEAVYLLEEGTNFIAGKGIVTTLPMLVILFLIAVCCGVITFAGREEEKSLKMPVGIFGFLPAPLMVVYAVLNIIGIFKTGGFLGYDILIILSAIGFVLLGGMNIKGKTKEKLPVGLVMLLPLAMCMNAVVLKVQPIANTMFLYYGLSAITVMAFLLMLFKNAYAPSKMARPMLYVASLFNFIICGCAGAANFIGGFVMDLLSTADTLFNLALAIIGVFSLFVALNISPSGEKVDASEKTAEKTKKKAKKSYDEEYDEFNSYGEEEDAEDYVSEFLPRRSRISSAARQAFSQDADTREIDRISQSTIAALFARKEEKEQDSVNNAMEEITAEIAVTQAVENGGTQQAAPVEATREMGTMVFSAGGEKTVFKGSGKKEKPSGKVVYKAPKK